MTDDLEDIKRAAENLLKKRKASYTTGPTNAAGNGRVPRVLSEERNARRAIDGLGASVVKSVKPRVRRMRAIADEIDRHQS